MERMIIESHKMEMLKKSNSVLMESEVPVSNTVVEWEELQDNDKIHLTLKVKDQRTNKTVYTDKIVLTELYEGGW